MIKREFSEKNNIKYYIKTSSSILALGVILITNVFAMEEQRENERPTSPTPKKELKQRANGGDAQAQYELGMLYKKGGSGVIIKKPSKALTRFNDAALQGHLEAQISLARMYFDLDKEGIPKDNEQALKWIQKVLKTSEDPRAQTLLGRAYFDGWGVPQNESEGIQWFQKAAEQGDVDALNRLAYAYDTGRGIRKDVKKAADLTLQAAKQGLAAAQCNAGHVYFFGRHGIKKDQKKALEWYLLSAEQGYADAQAEAGYILSFKKKKYAEGMEWLLKADQQGHQIAAYNIAVMYEEGKGVKKNKEEAKRWYQKSADQGYRPAQEKLARDFVRSL
ncbi:MAG: hypothetical protein BGO67_05375 [Alphaproteobacteria bacterium 41-28]|nr:MAG: hypothetical protein BGO67_05375 [Alphaproteobacteria bacterium 41-28]